MQFKARPASIRVRLSDPDMPGAIHLALPASRIGAATVAFAVFFAIFAAIEWHVVSGLFGQSVDDVFDLTFLLFQAFWALGWSVGVILLGVLTVLFACYSESARLENGKLVHISKLGPLKILADYELAKVRNVRLEQASANHPDKVQLRFDYEGAAIALGSAMLRADGQRLVGAITTAAIAAPARLVPHSAEAPQLDTPRPLSSLRADSRPMPPPLTSEPAIALIAANAVPLIGVLFFGWDLGDIMVLYWLESGVIAFYTVLKIAIVGKVGALVAAPFFMGHFGGFMTAHFLFIYALFLRGSRGGWAPGAGAALYAIFIPVWTSIVALFMSHGVSFYMNFLGAREYECATVSGLMTAPYTRIMVMHLTLIFGGWIIMLMGMPTGALVVLLALKTVFDLQAHRREHHVTASKSSVARAVRTVHSRSVRT